MRSGKNNGNYKHGLVHGSRHPLYTAWQNMKGRCKNKNNPKYHRYGGRGIQVCKEWLDDVNHFVGWALSNGWEKGKTLDRIDNDGNYEPSNCQWVSVEMNSRKKSTTKLSIKQAVEIREKLNKGENEMELAKEYNVTHGTIWFIKNKITHDETLS